MLQRRQVPILRYLRDFVRARLEQDGTDGELLHRFAAQRDPAAFAELVSRHGPLVWGVCRRQLPQLADAEDAFQATFLVLVRKAAAIRRPERLGNWLYGVACRVAAKGRVAAAVRAAREQKAACEPAVEPVDEVLWRDVRTLLDEEVQQLPDRYRAAFVLCYLEGLTNQEAASRLGCPEGTVVSRLAWARQRLRSRLTRRGLTLSAGAVSSAILQNTTSAAVPSTLLTITASQGAAFAAGGVSEVSPPVLALTQGVLHAMWTNQISYVAMVMIVAVLALTSSGLVMHQALAEKPQPAPQAAGGKEPDAAIQVVRPKLGKDVTVTAGTLARVEAYYRAELRSRVGGAVKAVNAAIGSSVKQGDVLVEVEGPELLQLVREKNAVVDQRRIELASTQKLFKKAVVTDTEVEIKAAQLEAARAELDRAKSLLDAATLRAPFDGVVVRRAVDPGTVVPKDSEPLLVLERQDLVTIATDVSAKDIQFVAPGSEIAMHPNDATSEIIHAAVTRLAPSISAKDGTARLEVDVWNGTEDAYRRYLAGEMKKPEKERFADLKQRRPPVLPRVTGEVQRTEGRLFLPGMLARIAYPVKRFQQDYFLPSSAFFDVPNQGRFVALVEQGRVRLKQVSIRCGDMFVYGCISVLEDGKETRLTGNAEVILKDQKNLKDGQAVKTVLVTDWRNAAAPAK